MRSENASKIMILANELLLASESADEALYLAGQFVGAGIAMAQELGMPTDEIKDEIIRRVDALYKTSQTSQKS